MRQEMECFILFALFPCLDCVSANNRQCGANDMGDDCRVIEFKERTKNKILKNHIIRRDQVQDKGICELRCYLEPNCVSYNYGPRAGGTFTCELNNMTHLQAFDSFEDKSGFLYTEIFNPCESNPCVNHATCLAGFGEHGYCCLCSAGFQGVQCETDIDECSGDNLPCDVNAHCANTYGSFTCTCKEGYTGNGLICTDIDECSNECHFAIDCASIAGSFDCSCKSGHLGDGRHFCSDNWKKMNIDPVCFGTKNDDYGSFEILEGGKIYTFKLVHTNGSVTCSKIHKRTKWGCSVQSYGNNNLMTVITYSNKTVLPFPEFVRRSHQYLYQLGGADVNSPMLVFNLLATPLVVSVGQQLQVWYGQDLANFTENNNAGKTCIDVHALYSLD